MASESTRSTITIQKRKLPSGPRRWVDRVAVPEGRAGRKFLGAVFTLMAALIGIACMVVYSVLNNQGRPGAIIMALLALVGCLVSSLFAYAKRLGASHALEVIMKDSRPPVLLLRAFQEDYQKLPGYQSQGGVLTFNAKRGKTFEEYLHDAFTRVGPVIAIGRPGERTPPLGASRLWVRSDEENAWKEVVQEMLPEAQYAVLIMGNLGNEPPAGMFESSSFSSFSSTAVQKHVGRANVGLRWEAKQLFGLADREKIVLVMPPVDEQEAARRWGQYERIANGHLPPYQGGEIAAAFDASGDCRVARIPKSGWFVKTFKRDLYAYQSSIDVKK